MENETYYRVVYEFSNPLFPKLFPKMTKIIGQELMRGYNHYASKANQGVTDLLNSLFNQMFPNYFVENSEKDWDELTLYNSYMANGYSALICNEMNAKRFSTLLDYSVISEELAFIGTLKGPFKTKMTVQFYMVEVK